MRFHRDVTKHGFFTGWTQLISLTEHDKMFKTFKASIETQVENELIKKGDAFNFNPHNPWTAEFVIQDVTKQIFEFSKEDIIFSEIQKEQYKDYLRLNPFSGGVFADGVKYKLFREHEKGKTNYIIEVDGDKAKLKLGWWNRQKIEWVHGKKVNWTIWQVMVASIAVIVVGTVGYFNYTKNTSSPTTKDTLIKSNTNQLPSHVADTTKKSDSTISLPDTIKH